MNDINSGTKAICVLGMHRSGTSTITRALNLLGAYIGNETDLVPPAPDNPEGFWERQDIVDLDDKILHYLKMPYDTNFPPSVDWFRSENMKPYRNEALRLLESCFSGRKLWAWKDPRTTVLFDFWKDVVRELGAELVCFFAVRNPLDVAKSLEKRNLIPPDRAYAIWFNYNICGLMAVADVPTIFISYDRFLNDWIVELKKCATGLGINWPEDDTELKNQMNAFIRPGLRHSSSGVKELEQSGAPEPVIKLYELLNSLVEDDKTPDSAFYGKVKTLYDEFYSYARFYYDNATDLWELQIKFQKMEQALAEQNQQIAMKDGQLAEQCAEQERQLVEKDRQIAMLLHSYSWRLTAPLRKLFSIFSHDN